jgi:glucoamylase
MLAAMSIPWGEAHGDEDGLGGYHLVWTRDLCQSAGRTLRIIATSPFRLRWSPDNWAAAGELDSRTTSVGLHFADLATKRGHRAPLRFTFFWPEPQKWEGRDYHVDLEEG